MVIFGGNMPGYLLVEVRLVTFWSRYVWLPFGEGMPGYILVEACLAIFWWIYAWANFWWRYA